MGVESDLLARMLQRLAEVLASAREAKNRRLFAEASRLLGDAWKNVFGLDRRFLQMMQPAQVTTILGSPARLRGLVELLFEEADLLRLQGDFESAAATARWAVRIVEAAKLATDDAELRGLLMRLRAMSTLGAG